MWYGVLIIAVVGVTWLILRAGEKRSTTSLPGVAVADQGREHVPGTDHVPYNSVPPTSGPHSAKVAPWGYYSQDIQDELQVHNLEHGGVLVQYSCQRDPALDDATCTQLANDLVEAVKPYSSKILVAPDSKLTDTRIALTAWARIQKLEMADQSAIRSFVDAFRNHGPESVPDEPMQDFRGKQVDPAADDPDHTD